MRHLFEKSGVIEPWFVFGIRGRNYVIYLLSLASAPVVIVFTYFYLNDQHGREPLHYLVKSFLLGALVVIPVMVVGNILQLLFSSSLIKGTFVGMMIDAFIIAALVEEVAKYFVLRTYMYNKSEFDEPFDGIMYAVAISLGFAAVENILYVFMHGQAVGWLRAFTAVPGHAMWAAFVGYYVGLAKFEGNGANSRALRMKGLSFAILGHGLYDFGLFTGSVLGTFGAFGLLIAQIFYTRRAILEHQKVGYSFRAGANLLHHEVTVQEAASLSQTASVIRTPYVESKLYLCSGVLHFLSIGTLFLYLFFILGAFVSKTPEPNAGILVGAVTVVCLGIVLIAQLIVRALKRGSYKAWWAALVISLFLLPNILFPAGIIGVYGLLHSSSRAACQR